MPMYSSIWKARTRYPKRNLAHLSQSAEVSPVARVNRLQKSPGTSLLLSLTFRKAFAAAGAAGPDLLPGSYYVDLDLHGSTLELLDCGNYRAHHFSWVTCFAVLQKICLAAGTDDFLRTHLAAKSTGLHWTDKYEKTAIVAATGSKPATRKAGPSGKPVDQYANDIGKRSPE